MSIITSKVRTGIVFSLFIFGAFLFAISSIYSPVTLAQGVSLTEEAPQTSSIEIDMNVGAVFRYGLGDGRRLSQQGYSSGFFYNQTFVIDARVDAEVVAPAPGNFALIAQVDNSKPDFLHSVQMIWDADNWHVEYGDFPMGRPGTPFAFSSRLLKGFKGDWYLSEKVSISAIHSQVSGNLETRTYRGSTVESTLNYSFHTEGNQFVDQPYGTNLNGLEYYELGTTYVEGFTDVSFGFQIDPELLQLLQESELGFLFDKIAVDPEITLNPELYYSIIPTEQEYFLALKIEYIAVLRELLFELIDDYNDESGLPIEQLQDYPFNQDTEFERAFLERLATKTELRVNNLIFQTNDSSNHRFYSLHIKDIVEESLIIEVTDGDDFVEITDPALVGYDATLYADIGVIELIFPNDFFQNRDNRMRVTFSYNRSATPFFVLGFAVLRNSEKVFLNGQLLQRDIDYLMEYEQGVLVLIQNLGEDDELRIEYETARGGIFGFTEFGRSFTGLNFHSEPVEGFELDVDLMQAHDSLKSGVDLDALQTMPNTHTVLGISGKISSDIIQGEFDIGVSQNLFPTDNNMRANQLNFVHVIEVIEIEEHVITLIGHRNGLHVFDGVSWTNYGILEGLAGQEVFDIEFDGNALYFGTSGGLTTLRINQGNPMPSFARKRNWSTYDERDGIPGTRINSVWVDRDTIWVGTDQALGSVKLADIREFDQWLYYQRSDNPEMPSNKILGIQETPNAIYFGTDRGLFSISRGNDDFSAVTAFQGLEVRDLVAVEENLYVATDNGLFEVTRQGIVRTLVSDLEINSVAVLGDEVWYSADEGLVGLESGRVRVTQGRPVTAIAAGPDSIWAGERADPETYFLFLYDVKRPSEYRLYQDVETQLDGRAENRFRDIPAEGHRDHGIFGRVILRKAIGNLVLQGSLEGITPQFSPVGGLNRQDHLRMNLTGTYPISPGIQMRAIHEEGLFDIFEEPTLTISDIIGFDFAPSGTSTNIQVNSTIRQSDSDFTSDGFDKRDFSFSVGLGQSLFNELISLNLNFDRDMINNYRRPLYSSIRSNFDTDLVISPLPGLTFGTGYQRPISFQFGERRSEHNIDWRANWTKAYPTTAFTIQTTAGYSGSTSIPTTEDARRSMSHSANLSVESNSVRLGSMRLSPGIILNGSATNPFSSTANLDYEGVGSLRFDTQGFDGNVSFTKSFLTQGRTELTRHKDTMNINLEYLGFADIDPSISFTGGLDTFVHPLLGEKKNGNYSISLSLAWRSAGPISADLFVARDFLKSDRDESVTYILDQTIWYRLAPGIEPSLGLRFDYQEGVSFGNTVSALNGQIDLGGTFSVLGGLQADIKSIFLFTLDSLSERDTNSSYLIEFQIGCDVVLAAPIGCR